MRILIHGRENVGWAIDSDADATKNFLIQLGYKITDNIIFADIVHSVYWSQLLDPKYFFYRFKKKVIATATNMIETKTNKQFKQMRRWVYAWIAPSRKQYNILSEDGVRVFYQPFFVDDMVFSPKNLSRRHLCNLLDIPYDILGDKFIVGSFQRDSLGSNLSLPKWQKNPDLLIDILKQLRIVFPDKFVLLLAGPRRHYIIKKCEEYQIPYYFYGNSIVASEDDIFYNLIDKKRMALLYNLLDCNIVTSCSEGGPKAIIESIFCKKLVFSTPVGWAPDLLHKRLLFNKAEEAIQKLKLCLMNGSVKSFAKEFECSYNKCITICGRDKIKERWKLIYDELCR